MFNIVMKFTSGHECRFKCKHYEIFHTASGELTGFSYEDAIGECPVYFQIKNVELIAVSNEEENL